MYRLLLASLFFTVASATKTVKFELNLDDRPSETGFELRGPMPSTALVDHAQYNDLTGGTVERSYELTEGKYYYLMLLDSAKNGIDGGNFQISTDGKVLKEGDGNFHHGKVWNFLVPGGADVKKKRKKILRGSSQ